MRRSTERILVSHAGALPRPENLQRLFDAYPREQDAFMASLPGAVQQVVAQRLVRYAEMVGPESVIAGTDCGLGGRVGHPEIVWAKLTDLSEGEVRVPDPPLLDILKVNGPGSSAMTSSATSLMDGDW